MYLTKLAKSKYKSFNWRHIVRLQNGVNIITGDIGSGKTNLCTAIDFLVRGAFPGWGQVPD